jgi:hypothetical protein
LSSLARSSSLGVGLTSVSPVSDLSAMSSPPTRSCDAQLQHRPSRRNSDAAACSPDDGVDSELDQELDPLPFALEDVFNDPPGGSDASFAPCTNALTSARFVRASGSVARVARLVLRVCVLLCVRVHERLCKAGRLRGAAGPMPQSVRSCACCKTRHRYASLKGAASEARSRFWCTHLPHLTPA